MGANIKLESLGDVTRHGCNVAVGCSCGQVRDGDGKLTLHWFSIPSRPIVSFAGIWRPAEGGAVFAFLTTEPNAVVAPIHPRAMPVLLHDEDEDAWLTAPIDEALRLVAPYPSQLMAVD